MNKGILILWTVLLIPIHVDAQSFDEEEYLGEIGVTFSSFGENDIVYFKEVDKAPGFKGVQFYSLGICTLYPINYFLDIESGIVVSFHKVMVSPPLPQNLDPVKYEENLSLFDIPVNLRFHFLEYFFINGGVSLNLDFDDFSSIHKQTGLGANFGLGIQYDFPLGVSVFVNPYAKGYTLLPLTKVRQHQRVIEYGLRLGIVYGIF